jgi:hypothetical protein
MPHSGIGQHPAPSPGNSPAGSDTTAPPPLLPSSSSSQPLSSAHSLTKLPRDIDDDDVVEKIGNDLLPLRARVPQINIQVAQQEQFTGVRAQCPGGGEVIHPRRISRGDVRAHDKILLLSGDEVECQEIGGSNPHGLDLKIPMFCFPEKGNTTLMRTCCL